MLPPIWPLDLTIVGVGGCITALEAAIAGESKLLKLGLDGKVLSIVVNHYAVVQLHLDVGYETQYKLLTIFKQIFENSCIRRANLELEYSEASFRKGSDAFHVPHRSRPS